MPTTIGVYLNSQVACRRKLIKINPAKQPNGIFNSEPTDIPHNKMGTTTVGDVRAMGGDVVPSPTETNPHHSTLSGLTPDDASKLMTPTTDNPNSKPKTKKGGAKC
jgi:hypothetical protein